MCTFRIFPSGVDYLSTIHINTFFKESPLPTDALPLNQTCHPESVWYTKLMSKNGTFLS